MGLISSLITPNNPLTAAAKRDINAPNFVQNFNDALAKCSIVVPQGVRQIASFAFDYRENDEVELDSEISDHWLEDNSAAQDHIAVRPALVTLSGYVSELTLSAEILNFILGTLNTATNGLSALPLFLAAQTPGGAQAIEQAVTQAQTVIQQVEQSVARGAQLANILSGLVGGPIRNKQQLAYLQLQAYQQARIIFTVLTPFQVFQNMAIESLRAVQPPETQYWSKFTVRMKQLNIIGANSTPNYDANLASPVASAQGQAPSLDGATAGRATAGSLSTVLGVPVRL